MTNSFPRVANGPAKPLSEEDKQRDDHGYTHPNIHIRNYEDLQSYSGNLGIYGSINAYYTYEGYHHDEESTTIEIP